MLNMLNNKSNVVFNKPAYECGKALWYKDELESAPDNEKLSFIYGVLNTIHYYDNENILVLDFKECEDYKIRNFILKYMRIVADESIPYQIKYSLSNAVDFLGKVHSFQNLYKADQTDDSYALYLRFIKQERIEKCKVYVYDNGIIPKKIRASDVGYDLTAVSVFKVISKNTVLYETGVAVSPPVGFYTKIVPRSSLSKSGYMLTNSVGIIDAGYTGTLKIALTKVDMELPDLELPFCCAQLILEKQYYYDLEVVEDDLVNTSRAGGGFGSTNSL